MSTFSGCRRRHVQSHNSQTQGSNSEMPLLHWYCKPTCRKLANNFIDDLLKIQLEMGILGHEVGVIKDKIKNMEKIKSTFKSCTQMQRVYQIKLVD